MIVLTKTPSRNSKLGYGVFATYRNIEDTCPSTCVYKDKGCYAQNSYTGMIQKRAGRHIKDGEEYYEWISTLPWYAKVRLHVSGDFLFEEKPDDSYIEWVLRAHRDFPRIKAWTYTHAWRLLKQDIMNSTSLVVNASVDSLVDMLEAKEAGWPLAVGENLSGVDCPQQTDGIPCSECMLCFRSKRSKAVRFTAHGVKKQQALEALLELK